jgi:predicted transcriptional regulator
MKICDSLRIFKITVTDGSLILSLFSKNWNWQFFDSAIFKKLEKAVL